jgi:hypothetical protein
MKPSIPEMNMKRYLALYVLTLTATLCATWPASSQENNLAPQSAPATQAAVDNLHAFALNKARYAYAPQGRSREVAPPLVIQFSPGASNALEQKVEDLAVMTRLLEKALDGGLGEEEIPIKMGVRMLLTGSSRSIRAMYVEGLGPLFLIQVDFPLAPPPTGERKPPSAARSEWDKARAEVKGIELGVEEAWAAGGSSRAEYNPELVEALTQTLLAVLKQAAHIRESKPDECVAVSVFGPATRAGGGTALTLRAKKLDVDAFAKGDMDLAGFRRLTSLHTRAGAGCDLTGATAWFQSSRSISRNVAPPSSAPPSSGPPRSNR